MAKKILIIEDDHTVLGMLKSAFEKQGYKVIPAKDGEGGLKEMEDKGPDLVVVDTLLPGIDGFEVCRRIKEDNSAAAPKVIMITGSADAVDAVKARKMGADDYCAKTSDFSPLLKAVKKLI